MLLCGIIDELTASTPKVGMLAYFFCQAGDTRINNATSVVRGLISLLVEQQPSLASHILERYDRYSKTLFGDANAWIALSDIFSDILQDPRLGTVHLIVDALDECVIDREKLLKFVNQTTNMSRVKWIVSSRN